MVLAELNIRHTRRHQPTRRVALGDVYLPTSGPAYGAVLLGAVVAEHLPDLDEEQRELAPRLLAEARDGLSVPRIAMRYRLQTDLHGLERSRHRIVGEPGRVVLELDRHGRPDPQVIGALMAAAALPSSARGTAIRAVDAALRNPGQFPEGIEVRRLFEGIPGMAPYAPGEGPANGAQANGGPMNGGWTPGNGSRGGEPETRWRGVPSERRWAMEVLGLGAGMRLDRADVQARFRRLVRQAHPDHGAARDGAAERLAELSEARELLLGAIASGD
jgi:hypothetical protein